MASRGRALRVDGLAQLDATLSALPAAFREVAVPSIEAGAAIVESEAHSRVPYDEGDLDRSISTEKREDGLQTTVGSNLHYARFVEHGTGDTPAQPFLYPSFRVGARYVRKEMRNWAKQAVQKVRLRTKRAKR